MMRAGAVSYYVALLSAAELHGAAHQRPQAFQVMVDRRVRNRDFGRVRVRFYRSSKVTDLPVELRNSRTGQVRVAVPAVVAFDLASRPNDGGGLSNVATVLSELAEDGTLDPDKLVMTSAHYPAAVARRLGWLLDFVDSGVDTEPLIERLQPSEWLNAEDLLQPGGPRRGHRSRRWGIVENVEVELDL